MVVYIDGIIGLNFLVDLLLLLGVNRIAGYPPGMSRIISASCFGGGYAGLCMIPDFSFLSSAIWKGVFWSIVTIIAFGISISGLRRGILFILLSMALGGVTVSVHCGSFWGIVCGAAILMLLCKLGFYRQPPGRKLIPINITHNGISKDIYALYDTGNHLRDPITGESVMVVSPRIAEKLFHLTSEMLANPVEAVSQSGKRGFRLIPYATVGNDAGFMLGFRCGSVTVNGRTDKRMLAFAPGGFSEGDYDVITGEAI